MTKLYTHTRLVDIEFRHLYDKAGRRLGTPGPQGPAGNNGGPGTNGLNSTIKVWNKYLVTSGYANNSLGSYAIDVNWTPNTNIYTLKSYASAAADYLSKDYFIPTGKTTNNLPLFRTENDIIILKLYLHLLEGFAGIASLDGPPSGFFTRGSGFILWANQINQPTTRQPIAWSGEWFPLLMYPDYPSPGTFPLTYATNQRLFPRQVQSPKFWLDNLDYNWNIRDAAYDPDYEDLINMDDTKEEPHFSFGWGGTPIYYAGGLELSFDRGFQTFEGIPGGPFSTDDPPPVATFPKGGGCIGITMVYQEIE